MKALGSTRGKWMASGLAAVLAAALLAGCGGGGTPAASAVASQSQAAATASSRPAAEKTTLVLCADFSSGADYEWALDNDLITTKEVEVTGDVTVELLAEQLAKWSGLVFDIKSAEVSGDSATVDWVYEPPVIGGTDEGAGVDGFVFHDAVTENWFKLDSLYRTIMENLPVYTIYYSCNGGQPLALEEMQGLEFLPLDQPYFGSSYFHSDSGDFETGHNVHEDSEYGLVIYYPEDFNPVTYTTEWGVTATPLMADTRTSLEYWVIDNDYNESPEEIANHLDTFEYTLLGDDVVVGYSREMNQDTGELRYQAYYQQVWNDRIIVVYILCQSQDEAADWYYRLENGAVYIEVAAG